MHHFDAISFLFGLGFTLLGGAFLLAESPLRIVPALIGAGRWAWPALLVLLGAALLIPVLRREHPDGIPEEAPNGPPPAEG
ncbi:MAG: hypothetical protein ACRDVM_09425 [Acidimicrobiia bacterium]